MNYSRLRLISLTVLRILVGWHLLYEGISKLINPYWSSAAFLLDSKWLLSGVAQTIVANPTLLSISDNVNMWGLTLVGALLLLGLFARYAAVAGAILVLLYYFFAPPFFGLEYSKKKKISRIQS